MLNRRGARMVVQFFILLRNGGPEQQSEIRMAYQHNTSFPHGVI